MLHEVKVPTVGESVQQVEILRWHKRAGEPVQRDDILAELETDKATVDVTAPHDGILNILVNEGETITPGQVIATITEDKSVAQDLPSARTEPVGTPAPAPSAKQPPGVTAPHPLPERGIAGEEEPFFPPSPAPEIPAEQQLPAGAEAPSAASAQIPPPAPSPLRGITRSKPSLMRRRIAERLVAAQHAAAMLTSFNEIDMSAVSELRRLHGERFRQKHGVKLGFMSFFIHASCKALKMVPIVNAMIDGDELVLHHFCDIAVAVATERGLVVPVLRDCDHLSLAAVEERLAFFAQRARDGSITAQELSGGTFSITNGGVFGSLLSTPILNHPQSAILGMHKIEPRPIAVDGQVVIRPMMYVALSYDHRIIDGKDAVQFLSAIKDFVEEPTRLLLEV